MRKSGRRGIRQGTRASQIFLSLIGPAIVVLFVSCSWSDPFEEYRGIDLIANQAYTVDDFVEGYIDGSDPTTTPNYTALTTPGSYGTTTGLPDTTSATLGTIRSLETLNLVPNGDFETGLTTPWIIDGSGLDVEAPGSGSGFVVEASGQLSGAYIAFNVSTGQGAAVWLDALPIPVVVGGQYFLQFRARRALDTTTLTLDFGDDQTTSYNDLNGVSWESPGPDDDSTPAPESFPDATVTRQNLDTRFTVTDTPNYLYLGSPQPARFQQGYLDDVRVGRIDNGPVREVALETTPAEGLPLVPGTYTFSVYVKSEVDAEVTPASPNRFRAGQIALGVNGRLELFTAADNGWSSSEWVRVATVIELSPEEIESGAPARLQLATGGRSSGSVGSVLIARPTLLLGEQPIGE